MNVLIPNPVVSDHLYRVDSRFSARPILKYFFLNLQMEGPTTPEAPLPRSLLLLLPGRRRQVESAEVVRPLEKVLLAARP